MERSRQHILEELSDAALRTSLPERWTIHKFAHDYGIDFQIEIFDNTGKTTGLRFYVQLKATDNNEEADVLSLDRRHFEYWLSHSDPVLLLRYFAPTKNLKWSWMHDLEWRMKATAVSVNVASHLQSWQNEKTAAIIEKFVILRRDITQKILPLPVSICVKNHSNKITESLQLANLIKGILPAEKFYVFGEATEQCQFDVLIEGKTLMINHVGLRGFVVNLNGSYVEPAMVANLSVILLFLVACRYDKSVVAKNIASHASETLFGSESEEFQLLIIVGLIYALGINQAIPMILDRMINKEDPIAWLNLYMAGYLASMQYGQTDLWQKQMKAWAEAPPYPEIAASAAYNLANSLANSGSWQEAIKYYDIASKRDSNYLDRDYYWAELGAAQFEVGQVSLAVDSYKRAFNINQSPNEQWRLGDALFQCGHYEVAYQNITSAISNDPQIGSYPRLVALVCEELISTWGIKEQVVGVVNDSTQEKIMTLNPAVNSDQLIRELKPLLDISAIDPILSFNAGHYAIISGQPIIAIYRFLTCALINRGDIQAWACAITSAINTDQAELLIYLIETAYFHVGEALHEAILESFPSNLLTRELQHELINLLRATEIKKNHEFTLRIHEKSQIKALN